MKKIYFYCTRLRTYWVLLPLALILAFAIAYNGTVEGVIKLYPLIIISSLAIIFSLIFLFRMIEISYQEIRYIGRFSSRDSAEITEGMTLIFIPERHGKVKIKLMGIDTLPELTWMQNEDGAPRIVCMFRGKTWGGKRTVRRALKYFGVNEEDIDTILSSSDFKGVYENIDVLTKKNEAEQTEIHININVTV